MEVDAMPEDRLIPLEQLTEPPDAMRFEMDDDKLNELVDSIRIDGVLERLLVIEDHVRADGEVSLSKGLTMSAGAVLQHRYQVRAGHRRLLACRVLEFSPVPCTVFFPSDAAYSRLMVVENLIREEPSPLEEAALFKRIKDEPGITEAELKRRCGKPLGYIYSRIQLAEGDEQVAIAAHRRQISLGVAHKLNQIRYPAPGMHGTPLVGDALQNAIASADAYRAMFLERAIMGGCSIAQAESWVAQWRQSGGIIVTVAGPQAEPMPAGGFPLPQNKCAICGGDDRQNDMEGVYIHRDELAAIRAGLKMAEGATQ